MKFITVRPYDILVDVSMSDNSSKSYLIYNKSVSYNLTFLVNQITLWAIIWHRYIIQYLVRPYFNECHDDFSLGVKLRRHIRSGPLKPAPVTCLILLWHMLAANLFSHQFIVSTFSSFHIQLFLLLIIARWIVFVLYCIILHFAIMYSTLLYCYVFNNNVLWYNIPYCGVLHFTLLYCTVWECT